MATQRSPQDLLRRLEVIHLNGGRSAFVHVLVDIRVSQIPTHHIALARAVRSDAKGLNMMQSPCVRTTRAYIFYEWLRIKKRKKRRVTFATGNGHIVAR